MGNLDLTLTPYSEVTATLERLAHVGASSEGFARVRTDETHAKRVAVALNGTQVTATIIDRPQPKRPSKIEIPEGGSLHFLRVPVNYDEKWAEAIKAAGPDTVSSSEVYKIGDQYQPASDLSVEDIVLVNFGKDMSSDNVLTWGKKQKQKLRLARPQAVLAIGKFRPLLHQELGKNAMAVVSLEDKLFGGDRRVVHVWWNAAKRDANLSWFDDGWDAGCWFAFVRE